MSKARNAGIAIMGIGVLFAYSAITGKGLLSAGRSLLHGQKPQTVTNPIDTSSVSVGGAGGGGGTVGPVTGSEKNVMRAICLSLGAPPTQANVESLSAWRQKECPWDNQPPDGAEYTHNPFNTTYSGGSTGSVNSAGVKVYPNWIVGVHATVATLTGGYPEIVSALRSGKGICGNIAPSEFLSWSGQGYSSVC